MAFATWGGGAWHSVTESFVTLMKNMPPLPRAMHRQNNFMTVLGMVMNAQSLPSDPS